MSSSHFMLDPQSWRLMFFSLFPFAEPEWLVFQELLALFLMQ